MLTSVYALLASFYIRSISIIVDLIRFYLHAQVKWNFRHKRNQKYLP